MRRLDGGDGRLVAVFFLAGEVRAHVVRVYPRARGYVRRRVAYREAVFYYGLPFGYRGEGYLMPLRNLFSRCDGPAAYEQRFARGDGVQRDGYVVARIYANELRHEAASLTGRRRRPPSRPRRVSS